MASEGNSLLPQGNISAFKDAINHGDSLSSEVLMVQGKTVSSRGESFPSTNGEHSKTDTLDLGDSSSQGNTRQFCDSHTDHAARQNDMEQFGDGDGDNSARPIDSIQQTSENAESLRSADGNCPGPDASAGSVDDLTNSSVGDPDDDPASQNGTSQLTEDEDESLSTSSGVNSDFTAITDVTGIDEELIAASEGKGSLVSSDVSASISNDEVSVEVEASINIDKKEISTSPDVNASLNNNQEGIPTRANVTDSLDSNMSHADTSGSGSKLTPGLAQVSEALEENPNIAVQNVCSKDEKEEEDGGEECSLTAQTITEEKESLSTAVVSQKKPQRPRNNQPVMNAVGDVRGSLSMATMDNTSSQKDSLHMTPDTALSDRMSFSDSEHDPVVPAPLSSYHRTDEEGKDSTDTDTMKRNSEVEGEEMVASLTVPPFSPPPPESEASTTEEGAGNEYSRSSELSLQGKEKSTDASPTDVHFAALLEFEAASKVHTPGDDYCMSLSPEENHPRIQSLSLAQDGEADAASASEDEEEKSFAAVMPASEDSEGELRQTDLTNSVRNQGTDDDPEPQRRKGVREKSDGDMVDEENVDAEKSDEEVDAVKNDAEVEVQNDEEVGLGKNNEDLDVEKNDEDLDVENDEEVDAENNKELDAEKKDEEVTLEKNDEEVNAEKNDKEADAENDDESVFIEKRKVKVVVKKVGVHKTGLGEQAENAEEACEEKLAASYTGEQLTQKKSDPEAQMAQTVDNSKKMSTERQAENTPQKTRTAEEGSTRTPVPTADETERINPRALKTPSPTPESEDRDIQGIDDEEILQTTDSKTVDSSTITAAAAAAAAEAAAAAAAAAAAGAAAATALKAAASEETLIADMGEGESADAVRPLGSETEEYVETEGMEIHDQTAEAGRDDEIADPKRDAEIEAQTVAGPEGWTGATGDLQITGLGRDVGNMQSEGDVTAEETEADGELVETEIRVDTAETEMHVQMAETEMYVEVAEKESSVEMAESEKYLETLVTESRMVEMAETEAEMETAEKEAEMETAEIEAEMEMAETEAGVETGKTVVVSAETEVGSAETEVEYAETEAVDAETAAETERHLEADQPVYSGNSTHLPDSSDNGHARAQEIEEPGADSSAGTVTTDLIESMEFHVEAVTSSVEGPTLVVRHDITDMADGVTGETSADDGTISRATMEAELLFLREEVRSQSSNVQRLQQTLCNQQVSSNTALLDLRTQLMQVCQRHQHVQQQSEQRLTHVLSEMLLLEGQLREERRQMLQLLHDKECIILQQRQSLHELGVKNDRLKDLLSEAGYQELGDLNRGGALPIKERFLNGDPFLQGRLVGADPHLKESYLNAADHPVKGMKSSLKGMPLNVDSPLKGMTHNANVSLKGRSLHVDSPTLRGRSFRFPGEEEEEEVEEVDNEGGQRSDTEYVVEMRHKDRPPPSSTPPPHSPQLSPLPVGQPQPQRHKVHFSSLKDTLKRYRSSQELHRPRSMETLLEVRHCSSQEHLLSNSADLMGITDWRRHESATDLHMLAVQDLPEQQGKSQKMTKGKQDKDSYRNAQDSYKDLRESFKKDSKDKDSKDSSKDRGDKGKKSKRKDRAEKCLSLMEQSPRLLGLPELFHSGSRDTLSLSLSVPQLGKSLSPQTDALPQLSVASSSCNQDHLDSNEEKADDADKGVKLYGDLSKARSMPLNHLQAPEKGGGEGGRQSLKPRPRSLPGEGLSLNMQALGMEGGVSMNPSPTTSLAPTGFPQARTSTTITATSQAPTMMAPVPVVAAVESSPFQSLKNVFRRRSTKQRSSGSSKKRPVSMVQPPSQEMHSSMKEHFRKLDLA